MQRNSTMHKKSMPRTNVAKCSEVQHNQWKCIGMQQRTSNCNESSEVENKWIAKETTIFRDMRWCKPKQLEKNLIACDEIRQQTKKRNGAAQHKEMQYYPFRITRKTIVQMIENVQKTAIRLPWINLGSPTPQRLRYAPAHGNKIIIMVFADCAHGVPQDN